MLEARNFSDVGSSRDIVSASNGVSREVEPYNLEGIEDVRKEKEDRKEVDGHGDRQTSDLDVGKAESACRNRRTWSMLARTWW